MNSQKIKDLLTNALSSSLSYKAYRDLVHKLTLQKKSTGTEQSEALTNYSILNDRRMKRLDKTLVIPSEKIKPVSRETSPKIWLVLTEGWCGDAAQSLPVIHKVATLYNHITLKIILRDEHVELMNHFLTNGGMAIPKLLIIDPQTITVKNIWGPRPSTATKMVEEYKAKNGELDAEFKKDLQIWYTKDKGQTIVQELLNLIDK